MPPPNFSKLDPYAGIGLGYYMVSTSVDGINTSASTITRSSTRAGSSPTIAWRSMHWATAWRRQSGLTAGMVLFISTVGSFAGTNATAFYLISLYPVSRIIVGLGIICLAVSLTVLLMRVDRRIGIPDERTSRTS